MNLKVDTKKVQNMLVGLADQLPYITMLALNDTAFDAQSSLKSSVLSTLKINKKTVANAFRVKKAKKTNLEAKVFIDEFAWQHKVLEHHAAGGDRERKGMESALIYMGAMAKSQILVPVKKITPDTYVKMMSRLKLNYKSGYTANISARSMKKKKSKFDATKYFIATKQDSRTKHLAEGIYSRAGKAKKLKSMLMIRSKPNYNKVLDINTITNKVINRRFWNHFETAMKRAVKTRR